MHRQHGSRPGRLALVLFVAIAATLLTAIAFHRPADSRRDAPRVAAAATPASRTQAAQAARTAPSAATPAASPTEPAALEAAALPAPARLDPAAPARAAGMVVGIDPETGRPGMPTRAQREELERQRQAEGGALASPALDRSDAGLTVIHKPDGSKMIDLQGRFQEYAIIKITPDGRKIQSCVQGPQVEAALRAPATPAEPAAPNEPAEPAAPTPESAER